MLIFWHWWGISSARKRKSSTYAANNIISHRGSSIQWPQFPPATMTGSSATMPSVGGVTEVDTNWRTTTYDKLNTTIAFVCLLLLYIRYLNLFNLRNGVPRGQLKAPYFCLLHVYTMLGWAYRSICVTYISTQLYIVYASWINWTANDEPHYLLRYI